MKVDLAIVARDLKLPPEKIEKTVELLDSGNTIPFITRFRKDLTGGLNEQQILAVKQRVAQLRALGERKAFIVKSIESQNKLTDEIKSLINRASSSRRLEDLYLPFKPKKQSRASLARQQGLEPLAEDIFSGSTPDLDLATRATDFVRVDKGLNSVDEVIKGVGDLLAERFAENDELRSSLRKIMWNEGKLTTKSVQPAEPKSEEAKPAKDKPAESNSGESKPVEAKASISKPAETKPAETKPEEGTTEAKVVSAALPQAPTESAAAETAPLKPATAEEKADAATADSPASQETPVEAPTVEQLAATSETAPAAQTPSPSTADATPPSTDAMPSTDATPSPDGNAQSAADAKPESDAAPQSGAKTEAAAPVKPKKKKKKKKKKAVENPYKDYEDFQQSLKQIPNHRVLAINRGERAGKLKVKIVVEDEKLNTTSTEALVPAEHPFKEFLQKCSADALNRMIVPSLEREIRRELTETAEKHAVEVFANNLRSLLLQPPIRNKTVLAIDPGFKRGCSVAVLDPCGNLLDSGHVFVVGNVTRREEGVAKITAWVQKHSVDVITIGNGAACRQTEQMVSDLIAKHFKEDSVQYVMVNEAGASIYSTSEIGREELPQAAPSIRSAVSIGRRLQDPLSELVKIAPANIGVGMYQHDVKAKHLSDSLDIVVAFCVNQVGVDVNTASPSLLKYVSGLNALTARRVVEYRQANGKFVNRDQLKEVSGFGDATFVQSAGFLRIYGGDSPLDATSIHPESYEIANDLLKRAQGTIEDLFPTANAKTSAPETPAPATETAASETPATEAPAAKTETAQEAEVTPAEKITPAEATEGAAATPTETSSVENTEVPATTAAAGATEPVAAEAEAKKVPAAETETPKPAPVPAPVPAKPKVNHETQQQAAKRKEVVKRILEVEIDQLVAEHSVGHLMVKDIVMALKRPNWDPRDKTAKPIFRRGIIKVDDLKPEMQLDAQVVNVVDFGVFVDIGLGESSLVHVSQLSNHFIRDPHRFFAVGDVMKVWVSEVDSERRRVKLTAIRPGSKRPQRRPRRDAAASKDRQHGSKGPNKPGKYGASQTTKFGNKYGGKGAKGKSAPRREYKPRKKPPAPVAPITEEMLEGTKPMRSFSDLAQFVSKKPSKKVDSAKEKENPKS